MKLREIAIRRFGALADRRVGPFEDGLNVVFGPNEAGKTTLFRFVRGTLHGFADSRRRGLVGGDGNNPPGTVALTVEGSSVQFERLVDTANGTARISPGPVDLPGLAEALAYFHPYEPDTTHAVIAACRSYGVDLHESAPSSDEIDRLEQILGHEAESLGTRSPTSLQSLVRDQHRLVEPLDRAGEARQRRQGEFESRRTALEARRRELNEAIECARTEREELERRIASLEEQRDTESRDRCLRTADRARRIEERLERLADLDARIDRARRVLGDLDLRAAELQRDVERGTTLAGPSGDPTVAVHELEAEVERLTAHGKRCRHCGGGHDTSCCDGIRSASETLRERVYRLCELVGRREVEARAIAAREELRELDACRRGLRTQLESLVARRGEESEALSSAGVFELLGRAPGTTEFCRCERHHGFLEQLRERLGSLPDPAITPAVADVPLRTDRELRDLRQRIAELTREIERLERQRIELETELASLTTAEPDISTSARERGAIEMNRWRIAGRVAELHELERRRTLIAKLRSDGGRGRESAVVAEGSALLDRITAGHCRRMRVSDAGRMEVLTASRGWADHDALSAGTQHVVGLAFRLAVAAELRRRGSHVPLLLDDVLVDNDLERQKAAVELLAEAAGDGQQVVLLTCHLHLREACRSRGGHVLLLGGKDEAETRTSSKGTSERAPRPPFPPRPSQPTPAARGEELPESQRLSLVTRQVRTTESRPKAETTGTMGSSARSLPRHTSATTVSISETTPVEVFGPTSNREYLVEFDDELRRLPGMTDRHVRLLGLAGVRTVGDLLELDFDENEAVLVGHGLERETVAEWRSRARLLATVPSLTAVDASALVEMGFRDARSIQSFSDGEFDARLRRLRETRTGRELLQSGRRFDRDWWHGIRERAGRARSYGGTNRPRRLQRTDDGRGNRNGGGGRSNGSGSRWANRTRRTLADRGTNRRTMDRSRSRSRRLDQREPSRKKPLAIAEIPNEVSVETKQHASSESPSSSSSESNSPRFHLSRSSPVVDAPSIGPKTAGRFQKIGVKTVDDLLECNPEDAAARIGKRHITADTIREWQAQARLCCRIPEIRGHDAQILVACGIDEPETLATSDPKQLLQRITPFCRTSAGKRIIRSGKAPDLTEVTAWISWSKQSRTLRAA